MSLSPGSHLGPYEINAPLGEGGMGVVYRATDSKLKRQVAIKVLPEAFAADADRLARFEREAQVLAQLQHPNIASIYGLEESSGVRALVMELVEGEDLAERLKRGPLPLDEALAVARQIAEALEAAHEKGIVHRDLKPANVKLTPEGKVKVLDFGLAKAMDPPAGSASAADLARSPTLMNSPTMTAVQGTQLGVILGTAAYMSPEQARGSAVDKRADVWAFGVVLHEMLTGRPLFAAATVTDTLAGVLKTEIDYRGLSAETPPPIRRLLARCLERDSRRRLRDIGEARVVLEAPLEVEAGPAAPPAAARSSRAARLGWAIAALLAIAAAALAFRAFAPVLRPPLLRFAISTASGASIVAGAGNSAISPDGRRVVFVGSASEGGQGLWLQELDQVRARYLAGTEGATYPFWAPDSRRIGFFAKGKLRKVSIGDGRVEVICDALEGRGGSWGRAGTIVFAPAVTGGLSAVSEGGGSPKPATRIENAEEEISHRFPSFLPDGRKFLYIADPGADSDQGRVYLASLDGGDRRLLLRTRRAPVYAAPGYLIHATDERLVAQAFDPKTGELHGEPIRLEEATPSYVNTQDRVASVSDSGALLVPTVGMAGTKVAWLDRRGRLVGEIPLPRENFASPALSPDGRRLAIYSDGPKDSQSDLWVVDLATEQASRLTFAAGVERFPVWSPDGSRLAFQTNRSGVYDVWERPSTGGGAERALHASPTAWKIARSWIGDFLVFESVEKETGFDVWILRPGVPEEAPFPVISSPASETDPRISPDGRWLAFASNESGRQEIYVVSLPDGKTRYQVTTEGARHPVWTRGGRELFYLTTSNSVAAVPVTTGSTISFGSPVTLFPQPRPNWGTGTDQAIFDVTADGSRVVVLVPESEGSQTLVVVTDWLAELGGEKRR